jgi:hypothetical protein
VIYDVNVHKGVHNGNDTLFQQEGLYNQIFIDNELHLEDEERNVEKWMQVVPAKNIKLVRKGRFSLEQIPGVEEICITFHP